MVGQVNGRYIAFQGKRLVVHVKILFFSFFWKFTTRIGATACDDGTHLPVWTGQNYHTSVPFQPRICVYDQIPPKKKKTTPT